MRSSRAGWVVIVVALGACSKDDDGVKGGEPAAPPPAAVKPAPPPEPSPLEKLLAIPTFEAAIDQVRPAMTDTDDETSDGTVMLALWAARHLRWPDVAVAKNETSFALVRKDSDASRGKRMCVRGRIIQIQKEKLADVALFSGLLLTGYSDITSFIVAGDTATLVQHSRVRMCGVVIGTYDYSNSGGGKGHAVAMVGMFDLPSNREAAP